MKYGCAVMPAAIDAFAACAVELLRDRAVVRVVQGFKAGVPRDEDLNLFLRSGSCQRRPEWWHPQRVALVLLLRFHAPHRVRHLWRVGARALIALPA